MSSTLTYNDLKQRLQILEKTLSDHKSRDRSDELKQQYLEAILNNTNIPVYLKTADYKYIFMNRQLGLLAHIAHDQVKGKNDFDLFSKPIAQLFRSQDEEVVKRRELIEFEETIDLPDGVQSFMTAKFPLFDSEGKVSAVGGACTDITARKNAEAALKDAHDELEQRVTERTAQLDQQTKRLKETNVALKILLEKRKEDKKDLEEAIMMKMENLIFPYLEKLKMRHRNSSDRILLESIESNLGEITSSFTHRQKKYLSALTPMQIQIADLIKHGYTTKEIADLLNLSPSTIACHRQEIRKRLSLNNKKINLHSALLDNA